MSDYNIGIVGSRFFNDYSSFCQCIDGVIEEYGLPTKIVSGGCSGTDTLAKRYAMENNIQIVEHLPNWNKYGKAAGPIRNQLIVNDVDLLVAFVNLESVGTLNTIDLAKKKNIKTIIFNIF